MGEWTSLYIHGSPASRMLRTLKEGVEVCVTDVARRFGTRPFCLSPLDELPFSDSVWSGNAGGRCQRKIGGTEAFTEHVMRDRWAEVRPPNRQELAGTLVLAPLTEASARCDPVPRWMMKQTMSCRLGGRVAYNDDRAIADRA